ncbi:MAG: putative rane protein [Gemmatimonadetes bacterium]|nr:putative rane protein [Gemmatimonadota bacterium]
MLNSLDDVDYSSPMPYMWADTLEAAERAYLLRLLVWAAASVLAGTAVFAWLRAGARHSPLLKHFAIQATAWGMLDALFAAVMLPQIAPRDITSATRLDRLLWLNIGLDCGYVLVGLTLVVAGWRIGRRLGLVGAGIGVVVQGGALVVLDLVLAAQISR